MLAAPAALLLSDTCPPGNLLPPNATVTALLLRLSDSDGKPLDDSWKAVGCAAVLGFNHVNSRNGAVVPSLASLPKDAPLLSYYPFDTLSTAAGGTAAYRAARAVAASNLVGPARSAVATPLATTASIDQLPMNSYWASSPELSAPVFSFFNRVWPSDTVPVQPLCLWMASLGWKHFGLLYVNDAYGRAYLDALIQVQTIADYGGEGVAKGPNVFVVIGFDADLYPVLDEADLQGMVGEGFAWLGADGITEAALGDAASADPPYLDRMVSIAEGFHSYLISPMRQAGYARLTELWAGLKPETCANSLFETPPSVFSTPPPAIAAYAYDASVLNAVAMVHTALASEPWSEERLLQKMRTLMFDGATGHCSLLPNGDRNATGMEVILSQWQLSATTNSQGDAVEGGRSTRRLAEPTLIVVPAIALPAGQNSSEAINLLPPGSPPVWGGGADTPPQDAVTARLAAELAEAQARQTGIEIGIAVASSLGSIAVVLILIYLYVKYKRRQRAVRKAFARYNAMLEGSISEAIASTNDMAHAAVLISAGDFLKLGRLRSHEELRDSGVLMFHDRLHQLVTTTQRIVFFSHQWTSHTAPDPSGLQYATMRAAILAVAEQNEWALERVWIWVDYIGIPQASRGTQALAINSLAAYSSYAHAFVIVAPPVKHSDTGVACNLASYNMRMWCRAENLCHILRNGVKNMWVATSERDCAKQEEDLAFIASNLRVMQGESTLEADKGSLVLPILGLYAELYACLLVARAGVSLAEETRASVVSESSTASVALDGPSPEASARPAAGAADEAYPSSPMWHAEQVMKLIEEGKDEIFPETYLVKREAGESRFNLFGDAATFSRARTKKAKEEELETQDLFGPLVGMMEAKIQSDELLRNKLYRGAVRREQQMTAGWSATIDLFTGESGALKPPTRARVDKAPEKEGAVGQKDELRDAEPPKPTVRRWHSGLNLRGQPFADDL